MEDIAPPTTSVGLFAANEMTPETVMSELNIFRTTANLPHWEASVGQAQSYTQTHPSVSLMHKSTRSSNNGISAVLTNGMDDFPMTSPSGVIDSGTSSLKSGDNSNSEDGDSQPPPRKRRTPIPAEKKDSKYWERRKKNNVAAKRSRELRKKKMDDEIVTAREAVQENQKLKQEIEVLKSEINSLRRLLRDANMTLSLWIRAKQASEPNAQLPPMLRNPNVSFVNFPVTST